MSSVFDRPPGNVYVIDETLEPMHADGRDVFVTSDTHFGHGRIIDLCGRPFNSVAHMNQSLIDNWNSVVPPTGKVFHLGDVALGKIDESLECIGQLNGEITLVEGNHDRPFMAKNEEQRAKWVQRYLDAGFARVVPNLSLVYFAEINGGAAVNLSHFPYEGDSHDGDRFESQRLPDNGVPLLHGHTHSSGDPVSFTTRRKKKVPVLDENGKPKMNAKGKPEFTMTKDPTLQIHVGMDAWGYTPVPMAKINELILAN